MKIGVFLSADNRWFLLLNSYLKHSFHPKLDESAMVLGEKDIEESEIRLVRSQKNLHALSSRHTISLKTNSDKCFI